jgi:hypothetical protein
VLTTVSTWITRAGTANEIAGKREIERLHKRGEELEKQVEAVQSERDGALRDRDSARRQQIDETGRVKEALQVEQAKRQEAERSAKAAEERAKAAEEKAKAAEQRANPPPATSPRRAMPEPAETDDALDIRRKLDNHLDTKFYASRPLEQTELVAGRVGRWYVMRLQRGGKPFVFGARQFRMPEAVQEIQESAQQLQKEILAHVGRIAKRVQIFFRGGADPPRVSGATDTPVARELLVLPRSGNNYGSAPKRLLPADPVRNEDLPNLRADWLGQQVRHALPDLGSAEIQLLENPPSPNQERTVDLIVYVEW